MDANGPVVVGFDGSHSSSAAVVVAADDADRAGSTLRIVHAYMWPQTYVAPEVVFDALTHDDLYAEAERLVESAASDARARHPQLEVVTAVAMSPAAPALRAESEGASGVVLGSRGLGGFKGLVMGSVTVQVAAHAQCPVLVVPAEENRDDAEGERITGPIVVGVDGSEPAMRALRRAFVRARSLNTHIVAVHGWIDPVSTAPYAALPTAYDVEPVEVDEADILTAALDGWDTYFPDVSVERRLVRDHPAQALIDQARAGSVIVVGSRGRGGFRGLLLGSVSQSVLHHSSYPVEIVR